MLGLRYDKWKLAFMEQRSHGFDVWQDPMVTLRVPKLFDLKADPFERADRERAAGRSWCGPRDQESSCVAVLVPKSEE